jgi:hypothetical protein
MHENLTAKIKCKLHGTTSNQSHHFNLVLIGTDDLSRRPSIAETMSTPSATSNTARTKSSRKLTESLPTTDAGAASGKKAKRARKTPASASPPLVGSITVKIMSGETISIPVSGTSVTAQALKRQIAAVDSVRFPINRQRLVQEVDRSDDTYNDDVILENDAPVACGTELMLFVADVAPMTLVRDVEGPSGDGAQDFENPRCAVLDSARDRLIVADTDNNRVVALHRTTLALAWQHGEVGSPGGGVDLLSNPVCCALSADGLHLFVLAETSRNSQDARIVTLCARTGSFISEHEIDVHLHVNRVTQNITVCAATGHVWIADVCGGRILCYDPSARTRSNTWRLVTSLGGLDTPLKLAIRGNHLLVSEYDSPGIQVLDVTNKLALVCTLAAEEFQRSVFSMDDHVFIGVEDSCRGFLVLDLSSDDHKKVEIDSPTLNQDDDNNHDEENANEFLNLESLALCSVTNELYVINRFNECWCGTCADEFRLSIYTSV